jgi:glycosyltransferase involved in cell wall biosynthesis
MLSILIPVHNYDIRTLLKQLAHQCGQSHLNYEIICLDDASDLQYQTYYQEIKKILKIQWLSTSKNIGRSAARNTLARQANFENVLFLDCDVLLPDESFISNYLEFIKTHKNVQVAYGSCIYPSEKPSDHNLMLHWNYGTKKENPSLKERKKHPYETFHTVNFLVKQKILLGNPFDESISKYGYEDSLWAKSLQQKNIAIDHFDNPVLHTGIHPTKQFLRKTAQAVHNLVYLEINKKSIETKLIKFLKKIKAFGLEKISFSLYKKNERRIVHNLLSDNPSMLFLSFYKLGLYMRFRKKVF